MVYIHFSTIHNHQNMKIYMYKEYYVSIKKRKRFRTQWIKCDWLSEKRKTEKYN